MVLQQCRYHHLHAWIPVWTQNCSGITKKNHSSARLKLPASKHFGVGSDLFVTIGSCIQAFNTWLTWTIKKNPWSPRDSEIQPRRKSSPGKLLYQLLPVQRHNSFKTSFFPYSFFFFFPLPACGEMGWWAQLEQKSFLAVLFLHIHFCYLWVGAQWTKHLRAGICWWEKTRGVRMLCHYTTTRKQSPIIRASHYIRGYSASITSTFITAFKLI